MRVFAVGGTKGGSGKTTLAVNLAAAWTAAGRTVLLVDADPQRSAASWMSQQEAVQVAEHAGGGLEALLPPLSRQFQAVVVDLPPGVPDALRSALRVAGVLLVPVQPSGVDIAAVAATVQLAQGAGRPRLRVRFVLSRVILGTVLGRTARGALEAAYPEVRVYRTELAQRIAHAEAAAAQLPVLEYAPHSQAAEEIRALAREVWRDAE